MYNDDTTRLNDNTTRVLDHSPGDQSTVDITSDIEVYFTKDIDVNTLEGNFYVINNNTNESIPGRFDYDKNESKVIYYIDLLEENTSYTVTIDSIKDIDGNEVEEYIFDFRTSELDVLEKHPPSIVNPADNSVVEESIVSWTTFHDYEGNYDLEISTDSKFNNLVYTVETTNTEVMPDIEYGQTYHARVKYDKNISDSIAKDQVEITIDDEQVSYVYFENVYKYQYQEKLYNISRAYIKSDSSLEVIDSGHSDEGEVYIKEDENDCIIIDHKLDEEQTVVLEFYYYVESQRIWSEPVSFYVKEIEYEDLSGVFEDSDNSTSFIEIQKPEDKNLVSPNIDGFRIRINSDLVEKEDIDINITGLPNNIPEFQSLAEEEKIDGVIKNFEQKSGYTIFDYIFKYLSSGNKGMLRTAELIKDDGQVNSLLTVYSVSGDVNNFRTAE